MKRRRITIWTFLLFVCLVAIAGCTKEQTLSTDFEASEVVTASDLSITTPTPTITASLPTITVFPTNTNLVPTAIEESPSSTKAIITSPIDLSLLTPSITEIPPSFDNEIVYLSFADAGLYAYFPLIHDKNEEWLTSKNILRSEMTIGLSFSNNHALVSYITEKNEIIVADLSNKRTVKIMTLDPNLILSNGHLIWTPDDMHLIIDPNTDNGKKYILHMLDGKLEQWNYLCNRLFLSPRTMNVAVLCESADLTASAVMEWGGEIWYGEPFSDSMVNAYEIGEDQESQFDSFPLYYNVGWSSDGNHIAFYDPDDPQGTIKIIDSRGAVIGQKIRAAYWLSEFSTQVWTLPGKPIQWARNGTKILFFGIGDESYSCLSKSVTSDSENISSEHACWQILDRKTNTVVWSIKNLQELEPEYRGTGSVFPSYEKAIISSNGKYLAIYSFYPGDVKLYILDLDSGLIVIAPPFRVMNMRWGQKD